MQAPSSIRGAILLEQRGGYDGWRIAYGIPTIAGAAQSRDSYAVRHMRRSDTFLWFFGVSLR